MDAHFSPMPRNKFSDFVIAILDCSRISHVFWWTETNSNGQLFRVQDKNGKTSEMDFDPRHIITILYTKVETTSFTIYPDPAFFLIFPAMTLSTPSLSPGRLRRPKQFSLSASPRISSRFVRYSRPRVLNDGTQMLMKKNTPSHGIRTRNVPTLAISVAVEPTGRGGRVSKESHPASYERPYAQNANRTSQFAANNMIPCFP